MTLARSVAFAILCLSWVSTTQAADIIGLSLPLSGRTAPVGERMKIGVQLAIAAQNAAGGDLVLKTIDDACDPVVTKEAAERLRDASLVVGPVCFDVATTLAFELNPRGGSSKIPVIAFGTRNKLLERTRDHNGLPVFTIGNTAMAEAEAIVNLAMPQFHGRPFAIVDDGSVHGRSLADDIRLLGEAKGFKPAILSNFRPLQSNQRSMLRRLARSGVEAVILSGAPEDTVTIMSDIKSLGYDWQVVIGEQASLFSFADGALEIDGNLVLAQETTPQLNGVGALLQDLKAINVEPEISVYHGYMLGQIAAQIVEHPDVAIETRTFDTIMGPITFGDDGQASFAPFALFRWTGSAFEKQRTN